MFRAVGRKTQLEDGMTIRILLTIDDHIAWENLRQLIQQHPGLALVAEAADIPSAQELTRRLRPDVVVMDIHRPLPEIIRTAKEMIRQVPGVKVITISMQSDRLYVERSFISGISGYLMKESSYEELIPAIRQVVAGKTYLSPEIQMHGL